MDIKEFDKFADFLLTQVSDWEVRGYYGTPCRILGAWLAQVREGVFPEVLREAKEREELARLTAKYGRPE